MRILMVRPGPLQSVYDVHMGWVRALKALGHTVADFEFDDLVELYAHTRIKKGGRYKAAFDQEAGLHMAAKHVEAACYEFWPDVLILTSGFWITDYLLQVLRQRTPHVVALLTECPYEDDKQLRMAEQVDTVIINDPTNLVAYTDANPRSFYYHHAYDPDRHQPGPGRPEWACDVAFVGTAFPSRVKFMQAVDWTGLDLKLGGSWQPTPPNHPLRHHLVHPVEACLDNDETADLYRSSKLSFNLYRKENNLGATSDGYALSPREIELAATGTFFLREPRGEGDEVLSMLPTFETPAELGDLARWWVENDDLRVKTAVQAREAIAGWTFDASARRLLTAIESAPSKF